MLLWIGFHVRSLRLLRIVELMRWYLTWAHHWTLLLAKCRKHILICHPLCCLCARSGLHRYITSIDCRNLAYYFLYFIWFFGLFIPQQAPYVADHLVLAVEARVAQAPAPPSFHLFVILIKWVVSELKSCDANLALLVAMLLYEIHLKIIINR